jgi:hypothetical protein
MSENNVPEWVKSAARVDRPAIDAWYKPDEHGALDGFLIWRGQQEAPQSGDVYNAYAIRLATGKVIGLSERAGLRYLRQVRIGSRVFIRPTGIKELENGWKMQQFEILADRLEPLTDPVKRSGPRGGGGVLDGSPLGSEDVPF